jgi:hypothetical protein
VAGDDDEKVEVLMERERGIPGPPVSSAAIDDNTLESPEISI